MPKLICISGISQGTEYALSEGENTIGRSQENTVSVFDKETSRRHCQIILNKDQLIIEDLNSTNGVLVNNNYISQAVKLNTGDHVRIGQTVFQVDEAPVNETNASVNPGGRQTENQQRTINLLEQSDFQVTQTTKLRRHKFDKDSNQSGFLEFFQRGNN